MPIYTYKCSSCNEIFECFHLMSETIDVCLLCEADGCVEKIPSFLLGSIKKEDIKKTGAIVEEHIKQAREELKQEKKQLRNKQL